MTTYIYDDIEVRLTGRYADKLDRANKKIRMVEIEATIELNNINLPNKWVLFNSLSEIFTNDTLVNSDD